MQGILVLLDNLASLPGGSELVRRVMMRARQEGLGLDPRVSFNCVPFAICGSDPKSAQMADPRGYTCPVYFDRYGLHE